jgi:hypothetical protein
MLSCKSDDRLEAELEAALNFSGDALIIPECGIVPLFR